MKIRFWMMGLAMFLALGFAAAATTYYINDSSTVGDVYCTQLGNDANDGRTPSTPKLALNNLLDTCTLSAGDVVLIDTGTYTIDTNSIAIGTNVNGVATNRIVFQGSTNLASGGTTFTSTNYVPLFEVQGSHLAFYDIRGIGGLNTFSLKGASSCVLDRIVGLQAGQAIRLEGGARSNAIRRCVFHAVLYSAAGGDLPGSANYMENCVIWSTRSAAFAPQMGLFSNYVNNIGVGVYAMGGLGYGIDIGSRNILSYSQSFSVPYETMADYCRVYTNFQNNTVADPKFVNADGFDFHLLSASGFVSNGVWVTNATVGFSPGIDFGPRE